MTEDEAIAGLAAAMRESGEWVLQEPVYVALDFWRDVSAMSKTTSGSQILVLPGMRELIDVLATEFAKPPIYVGKP